jgi:hypothetical protein
VGGVAKGMRDCWSHAVQNASGSSHEKRCSAGQSLAGSPDAWERHQLLLACSECGALVREASGEQGVWV